MQINGPVGTGDFVVFQETTISENIAEDFAMQLNHPTSKKVHKELVEIRTDNSHKKSPKQEGSRG